MSRRLATTGLRFALLLTFLWLLVTTSYGADSNSESWPVKRRIDLSSGFGDFRENRFHAGVDLRTGGKIGTRIYSPVDGYVWRLKMSYEGYGKGLYLKDKQGRFYVFGHLSRFSNKIGGVVLAEQYAARRYYLDLYFPPDSIPVEKGEFIGLTGQTGAGAPHLHYEVRNANNRPINPLRCGWVLKDKVRPTISRVGFRLVDDSSLFDDGRRKVYFPAKKVGRPGQYKLDTILFLNSPFGILADLYDQMRPGGMRQAVYRTSVTINGELLYDVALDSIDFGYGRSVNLEYDFPEAVDGRKRTRRLFDRPGNAFPGSHGINGGVFGAGQRPETGLYDGLITAEDAFGNTSTLEFQFYWGPPDDYYVVDTIMDSVVLLKPRNPEIALGADTVLLEFPEHHRVLDEESRSAMWKDLALAGLERADDGWLVLRSIAAEDAATFGRLKKEFPTGHVRYEDVADTTFERVGGHYEILKPWSRELAADGVALSQFYDGSINGAVPVAISHEQGVDTVWGTNNWQEKRLSLFVPAQSVTSPFTIVHNEGKEFGEEQKLTFYPVGHKKDETTTIDDAFTLYTSKDHFYQPRFVEILPGTDGRGTNPPPVTPTYRILPEAFVTAAPFAVALRVDTKGGHPEKTGLCWWNEKDKQWVWINDDTVVSGLARGLSQGGGSFAAVTDLAPPRIRNLNIKNGMTVPSAWPEVRCDLVDTLSGIADDRAIDIRLNGDWLIPEYDAEREVLVARPYNPVKPGECELTISVVDRVGNRTELSRTFRVVDK